MKRIILSSVIILILFFSSISIPQLFDKTGKVESSLIQSIYYDNDFINGTFDNVTVLNTYNGNELSLDIYENATWLNMNPITKPAGRDVHMMAAVYGTDKIVLYAGRYDEEAWYNDTWVYDKSDNTWTEKFPAINPGPRGESAMTAIWGTDKVMIFGGAIGMNLAGNDTWIYDLSDNTWTRKYPVNHPENLIGSAITSIYLTDKVILFGGYTHEPTKYYNGTWLYDLSDNNWTKIKTNTTPHAKSHYEISNFYNTDKVILFGGCWWIGIPYNATYTWIFDLSDMKWTNATPTYSPKPTTNQGMAPLFGTDKVVIFGGVSAQMGQFHNETWVYDLSENTWTKMIPDKPPNSRILSRMVSVCGTNKIIMFGGSTHNNIYFNDTWELNLYYYFYKGNYISRPYHIKQNSLLKSIWWNNSVGINTSIKFQLRTANSKLELKSKPFVGFDGGQGSYYIKSPSSIWKEHNHQSLLQYRAYLFTTNKNETPLLKNVTLDYNYLPNTTLIDPKNGYITNNNNPIFIWNFTDRDSANQSAFQIIIDDDASFSSIDFESEITNSSGNSSRFSDAIPSNILPDGTWYWQVRTKDNEGDWGDYSEPWKLVIDTLAPDSKINFPVNNTYYNCIDSIYGTGNESVNGTGLHKVEISIHRVDDDTYFDSLSWIDTETWLHTDGTSSWTYNSSAITWFSGWEYNIKSRAIDVPLNVETPEPGNTFIYDPDPVEFSNSFQSTSEILDTTKIEVGITITDDLSGVNGSSVEYTITKDHGATWAPWEPVPGYVNGNTIDVKMEVQFWNGTGNQLKWRASDLAGNGPTESKAYTINIMNHSWDPNGSILPKVRLLSPANNSITQTNSVDLTWTIENSNINDLIYDVYLDDTNPPMNKLSSNLSETSLSIENLSNGKTYYWTVIPKVGNIAGTCLSGTWSFTVDIPLPTVTLISPENNSVVTSIKPTLVWQVEYSGTEDLSYRVHLDTSPNLNYNQDVTTPYYMPQLGLVDNFTYYWRVVPYVGELQGVGSEVWSFTVKQIHDEKPKFEIDLALDPDELEIKPDQILFVEAIVTNFGDLTDNFTVFAETELGFYSKLDVEVYRNTTLEISPGKSKIFLIKVSVKDGSVPGVENITITAESELDAKYGLNVWESEDIIVEVLKKDEQKDRGQPISIFYFFIVLFIIILIISSIIILIIVRKRASKKDKKLEEIQDIISETPLESITTPEPEPTGEPVPVQEQQQDETLEE
jgi:hypothetical protein